MVWLIVARSLPHSETVGAENFLPLHRRFGAVMR